MKEVYLLRDLIKQTGLHAKISFPGLWYKSPMILLGLLSLFVVQFQVSVEQRSQKCA